MIPHSQPTFTHKDQKAFQKITYLSQGPAVARFEKAFARFHGQADAVAVNSGTSALHLALLALGVKKGQEVIIPSYVCTALLNAIHYVGATPILADVDMETGNISFDDVKRKRTRKTRALILPHMFGQPIDILRFRRLGVPIIEDCAQAVGAKSKSKKVGTIGDIGIFSFYATKMMATGEGGMLLARRKSLISKARDMREYDHKADYQLRYNYKMTDFQASLGLVQLKQLRTFIQKRKTLANVYTKAFVDLPIEIPKVPSIYFRFIFKTSQKTKLRSYLKRQGIMAESPVFKPIHLYLGQKGFPNTDEWYTKALSIPMYPQLTLKDARAIARAIQQFYS